VVSQLAFAVMTFLLQRRVINTTCVSSCKIWWKLRLRRRLIFVQTISANDLLADSLTISIGAWEYFLEDKNGPCRAYILYVLEPAQGQLYGQRTRLEQPHYRFLRAWSNRQLKKNDLLRLLFRYPHHGCRWWVSPASSCPSAVHDHRVYRRGEFKILYLRYLRVLIWVLKKKKIIYHTIISLNYKTRCYFKTIHPYN